MSEHDPARAKALLDLYGYVDRDGDGWREQPDGSRLLIAISVRCLISGLVVIENVFNYPGLGRLMVFAIDRRDLPLLQTVTMVTVLGFALAILVADLLYAGLNPRIRFGE